MKKNIMIMGLALMFLTSCVSSPPEDSGNSSWDLLKELLLIPGVSGSESKVADHIQAALPAELEVKRDDMDNLWFTVGEGEPHILFLAHSDELGLVVQNLTSSGTLKVTGRGGFFPLMYEGHTVVVDGEKGPVEGIVLPRPDYVQRDSLARPFEIEDFEIYLGVSTEEEARSVGIAEGHPVTIRKEIVELSDDLMAARGVDDRAGCAAVLAAALRIDWSAVQDKTITFAWDVEEEVGLFGASRLAETLAVDYVFPVDTFVSSAGPFDSRRFAYIPLGEGAVIRAIDSSNIAPQTEVQKVVRIARQNGIPVHLGNTRGGNDGSVFIAGGTVDIPLSWPGTYSHSFIEKIHRFDLEALTDLIVALVEDW